MATTGARAFVMLPKKELEDLIKAKDQQPGFTQDSPKVMVEEVKVKTSAADEEVKEAVDSLLDLMPKTYKSRAKSLMTFLQPYLRLDKSTNQLCLVYQGIVYDTLFDLVFYLFLPESFARRTSRPLQAHSFIESLIDMKVPMRLMQSKIRLVRRLSRASARRKTNKRDSKKIVKKARFRR